MTTFHQSLLRHESAVAQSQQGPFSSFKQLLDQMLPECACWIGGSRKPFAACAVWSLTKLNFTIYSLSALNTLFIESYTGYLLLATHKVCFTQLASTDTIFCCSKATHDRESLVGDGCEGCRQVWVQREVIRLFPKSFKEQSAQGSSLSPAVCWLLCQACCASSVSHKIPACGQRFLTSLVYHH